jgi:AraC-like DNA-binding protein
LPLKQLAWELGYNQASNFVTAFRRRFGVPPGYYRRVRESDR